MVKRADTTLLKERALINFEVLLVLWGVDWQKVGANEYDFLSPTRSNDTSFGACRFNISKGIGSDFAGISYSKAQYEQVGLGFTKEDFAGFSQYGESNPSFDVIGLCQRIHNISSYSEATQRLKQDLDKIDGGKVNIVQLAEQAAIRHERAKLQKEKMRQIAERTWKYCQDVQGTIGETYLNSRNIFLSQTEPNMKFHYKIFNRELNMYIPALIFKLSQSPDNDLKAVHRIWIALDGTRKARLEDNKKAIGSIEGNGIWFGTPCDKLYVCEGPEEALSTRMLGGQFVVSTVYANNYHNLNIPECVTTAVLVPDRDEAGMSAVIKAEKEYKNQGKKVKIKIQD